MSAPDWAEIDDIFQAALEASPDERASLLDRLCDGRQAVRHEVETLLEAHD